VLGGLLLALIPGVPKIELVPELVFLLFLPPLLYVSGFESSIRDVRAQLRPIHSLAVGLVLATTAIVAALAHALVPDLGWPTAFAFGSILSSTEVVPAAAIFRRLGVPRRLVTLLESESLANHATALAVYQAALMVSAAAFSLGETAIGFAAHGIGGVLVGLAVSWPIASLRRRLNDPPVEITISLLTPFAAYLPAEWLGVSGVLATATAGLFIGWRRSAAPRARRLGDDRLHPQRPAVPADWPAAPRCARGIVRPPTALPARSRPAGHPRRHPGPPGLGLRGRLPPEVARPPSPRT
jgi:CPA1 family monovalent cation:H+ antiporter